MSIYEVGTISYRVVPSGKAFLAHSLKQFSKTERWISNAIEELTGKTKLIAHLVGAEFGQALMTIYKRLSYCKNTFS
jgi:hypothetical protein